MYNMWEAGQRRSHRKHFTIWDVCVVGNLVITIKPVCHPHSCESISAVILAPICSTFSMQAVASFLQLQCDDVEFNFNNVHLKVPLINT